MEYLVAYVLPFLLAGLLLDKGASQPCGYQRGLVRLQGGQSERDGRVEVCNVQWGTVCDDQWDDRDARVVCRQLGLLTDSTVAIALRGAHFGGGTGSIWLGGIDCSGSENQIMNCLTPAQKTTQWTSVNCGNHQRDAGVLCLETDGGDYLRLVGGRDGREGRVEVFHGGHWGTVCDDHWDDRDAEVVCRQLGYSENTDAVAVTGSFFSGGSGNVWLDNVDCDGSESVLLACHNTSGQPLEWGNHNCGRGHNKDAGVLCLETDNSGASIRLMGGRSEREGRVEVFHAGRWGTVCDDFWDDSDAEVVCRQLGFSQSTTEPLAVGGSYFGRGSGRTWLDNVNCAGSESVLLACQNTNNRAMVWGDHNCGNNHNKDAGVFCLETDNSGASIRLVGGRSEREGRVEVFHNGQWGTVCDEQWDDRDARVACRQLGFTTNTVAMSVGSAHFGRGSGSIWLEDLNCNGTESRLQQCHNGEGVLAEWGPHNCGYHYRDAGALCVESDGSGDYIRLVGGRTEREGRVEVFHEGEWGTVCDNQWDSSEAEVVCRQLGLLEDSTSAVIVNGELFVADSSSIVLSGIQCSGRETDVLLCQGEMWGNRQCPSGNAGIACEQTGGCSEGIYRLAGGRTEREGRVEVCHGGLWGTVCHSSWTDVHADTVCRALDFLDAQERGALATNSAQFNLASGLIWLFNVTTCGRWFQRSCTLADWVADSCTHSNDVGVVCPGPKQELHKCVDIDAETLLTHGTLQSFINAVTLVIVSRVSTQCTAPCSYSQQDVEIDSSWPQAGQSSTNCIASDATIGFRVTCSFRPRLNQTVHTVVQSVLDELGTVISCENHRGSAIEESVPIVQCVVPETTSVLIETSLIITSEREAMTLISSQSVTVTSDTVMLTIKNTPVDIKTTSTFSAASTTQWNPHLSYSIGITNDNKSGGSTIDIMTIMVMVFIAIIFLLILLLILLASALLVVRKRARRRKLLARRNTKNSRENESEIEQRKSRQLYHPVSAIFTPSDTSNNIYEAMDGHDYALLEQNTPTSPQEIVTASSFGTGPTHHDYAFLEENPVIILPEQMHEEPLTSRNPERAYSILIQDHAYAILESEPGIRKETERSNALVKNGGIEQSHEYQQVTLDPDGTYDRTFANNESTT